MSQIIHCDIAIIGGGAGGLSLAAGAVQMGAKVVLIEDGKMGGDCLNYGCVPSKSLLSAAKAYWHTKEASYFGIENKEGSLNFKKVLQHVHKVINTISVKDSVERFEKLGVQVIQASGQFLDRTTVQAGHHRIKANRFVIATGSSPFVPPIPGLDKVRYYTNETIFGITDQPKHLIVIGGGPIGCELAQAFAMLGTKVTILEGFKILPKDEPDCVDIVRKELEKVGVTIEEGIKVEQVKETLSGIHVWGGQNGKKEIIGTHLLVATGRRPHVEGLNLEKADVVYSPKGIQVDHRLRTSNKKVYAMGDVIGGFQFTHIANYHAGIVLKNILFKIPAKADYRVVPWVTYTEPELAHVGMLEEEARQKYTDVQIMESPFDENDRAQTEHQTIGKIKVVATKKGLILGVTIVGSRAGELLLPWILLLHKKKNLRSLTDIIVPYPTFSEISKRVATAFYTPFLFSKKVQWLVKFLQKWG